MVADKAEKYIVWLGDSLSLLQKFPKAVRIELGVTCADYKLVNYP